MLHVTFFELMTSVSDYAQINLINYVAMATTGTANITSCVHTVSKIFQSYYQPFFPSTICFATSSGKDTPFISKSVIDLHPSIQASNGEQQTNQPAQKNPTGQARNISTRNQMIAHNTFILPVLQNAFVNLEND